MLLALLLAWLPALLAPQGISVTEGAVGDAFWRFGASTAPERRVVVVDIDERSLAQVGPWPWPRQTMAQISQRLAEAGALVQAYDIAFADERDGDAALRDAWSAAPVVAAQLFSVDRSVTPAVGVTAGAVAGACPPFAPQAHGYYGTSATLLQAHPAVGHITPQVESDGVVRKLPALVCRDGRGYVSLPMATLWLAAQAGGPAGAERVPNWQWQVRGSGTAPSGWFGPAAWLTSPSLPGLVVPLDGQGHLRVPYAQARSSFASVSAVDLLQGRADLGLLKGALVIVGATAFGLGDTVSTPHGAVASGVEVHAQTLVGLLDNRIPYTPALWPAVQALGTLALAAVLLGLAIWQRVAPAKRLPLAGAVMAVAIVAGAAYAQLQLGLWLPWLQLALFTVLASMALATVEHALARAQGERLSAHLGAYLPRPVAQRLMVTDPSGSLQVDQRNISVMVADIRNFSAFAAHHPPEETAALLHAFLCIAVDVVERHGGVVENVIGDSVLAVWNASPDCADHPVRALAAARELCQATLPLLSSRKPISERSPVQPLALGVGLESGAAIVGSFGPARRRAHAALGEPVSVANRIQQMTTDLSMPILVGPQLAALLPSNGLEPLGEYLLEGMGKHYRLFAPAGWGELVTIDPNWASSAVATGERSVDPREEWSRWGQTQRH
ncbi:MAG: CHASE2 domain-containing protein, partial [Rugosibacter sp.]|nr:CHASE2 domain-containing protein [Rugosibacter sp.]